MYRFIPCPNRGHEVRVRALALYPTLVWPCIELAVEVATTEHSVIGLSYVARMDNKVLTLPRWRGCIERPVPTYNKRLPGCWTYFDVVDGGQELFIVVVETTGVTILAFEYALSREDIEEMIDARNR